MSRILPRLLKRRKHVPGDASGGIKPVMIGYASGRRRSIERQPHEVLGRRLFEPKTRIVFEAEALVIAGVTENDASLGVGFCGKPVLAQECPR